MRINLSTVDQVPFRSQNFRKKIGVSKLLVVEETQRFCWSKRFRGFVGQRDLERLLRQRDSEGLVNFTNYKSLVDCTGCLR